MSDTSETAQTGQTVAEKNLAAVQQDGRALQNVQEQTEELCLAAVQQSGYALQYVQEQTPEMCLIAVEQDGSALQFVGEQTEEMCLIAVKQDGYALHSVNEQTPEICLAAVEQDGGALQFVNKQTEEMCLVAVKQVGFMLGSVNEQTPEICLAAVEQDGSALQFVGEQTEEMCLIAVQQNGTALQFVNEQTPEISRAAAEQIEQDVTARARERQLQQMGFDSEEDLEKFVASEKEQEEKEKLWEAEKVIEQEQRFAKEAQEFTPPPSDPIEHAEKDHNNQTNEQGESMSDENTNTQTEQAVAEKKKPYYQQNVEKVHESVKNGTAPFLVDTKGLGKDEKVNIQPPPVIRSANTGKAYKGINQLVAQMSLSEMGVKDTAVLTYEQAKGAGTYIKKGSESFVITSFDASAEEGQKSKAYHLFPVSSVADTRKLVGLQKIGERKADLNKTIECQDSLPEKYIGSYLAAASVGAKFETDAQTMNAFQSQFTKEMGQHIADGHHTKLFEMGKGINEQCKTSLKELYKDTNQKDVKNEYKNQRQKSSGMSR